MLLHGLTGAASLWTEIGEHLAAAGYHVLAPDLRGHGRSHRPGTYALTDYGADVTRLMEKTGPAFLVGHSMGAAVAWTVAATRPDLVPKLVLEDHHPDENPGYWRGYAEWARAWPRRFGSREEGIVFLEHAGRTTQWWTASLGEQPDSSWGWSFDMAAMVETTKELYRQEQWPVLRTLAMPVLLIRGETSPHLKAPVAERMQEAIPDCRLVTVPGADHWVNKDAPAYVPIIRAFLEA